MRSRIASGNSMPPDVTSTDVVEDVGPVSGDSEGSCTDSPLPSPLTSHHHRHHDPEHHGRQHSTLHGSHDSAHDYENTKFHYGSFYLRMGAVGKFKNMTAFKTQQSRKNVILMHTFNGYFYCPLIIAFGIGSMIYSGLEFGQYFELEPQTKCNNFMIALTPAVRMIFTFMQMYFIFLNSKMAVSKLRLGAKFGLMHMIGTNLCVWLNVSQK